MNKKVKIKISEGGILPSYSKSGDAGLDLTAISINTVNHEDYGYIEFGTGISIEIPEGFVGLVYPRSSISNTGMVLANSVAVIDSNYRGEIKLRFKYISGTKYYKVGERIAQLMIVPVPTVEFEIVSELTETVRGDKGFGSSNKVEEVN